MGNIYKVLVSNKRLENMNKRRFSYKKDVSNAGDAGIKNYPACHSATLARIAGSVVNFYYLEFSVTHMTMFISFERRHYYHCLVYYDDQQTSYMLYL